jgi:hypothetical protein
MSASWQPDEEHSTTGLLDSLHHVHFDEEHSTTGLLDSLRHVHVDEERSLMHEVAALCSAESLASLSAASHENHDLCRARLHLLHQAQARLALELTRCLGFFDVEQLEHVRALTIPDTLPEHLRPCLGRWLRERGRLAHINCVCCRSWIRFGEISGWIDLEPVRAGEPQRLCPKERFVLESLDTPDGLLKTVLTHACKLST